MRSRFVIFIFIASVISIHIRAQGEEEKEKIPFKQKLFTGGTISLAFYSNTFLVGGSPVLGYSITNWANLGIVINYNYTVYRDYYGFDDRLKQNHFGGGPFLKLYPLRLILAQAQYEYNFLKLKYIPPASGGVQHKYDLEATSFLIG